MTTPLEFMERVLPWPGPEGSGWGNLHWSKINAEKRKFWLGSPYKTAEALVNHAQKLAVNPGKADDVFFCTSIQATCSNHPKLNFPVAVRTAGNATYLKAIWLDVDVKAPPKGYNTLRETLDAIDKFCLDAKLPGPSALVLSGGGVHVYWISAVPLTVAQWRPFAEGLKAEAMRLGLRADYGCTADPARILRVPGTFNRKIAGQPRPVKVLGMGCDYDFAADLAGLAAVGASHVTATVTSAPFDLSAFQGTTMHPLLAKALGNVTDNLSDGIERGSDLPLDITEVIKGCGHFADCATNHGAGQGQGLWSLTLLASTWFEDGERWAHYFSKGYPTYDAAETQSKYDEKLTYRASKGLGWPSCKSFENEGCKACGTCPLKGTINSPLNLASRVQPPPTTPTNVVPVNPAVSTAVVTAADLLLPPSFIVDQGKICYLPPLDPDDVDALPTPQPVFHGYVTAKPWTGNGIPPKLHFKYRQGVNNVEVSVPYNKTSTESALQDCLSMQTVMTDNDKLVRRFMKSWIARIDEAYKRLTSAPFGWVIEDGITRGFAYGGRLFKCDGTEEDAGFPQQSVQADFTPTGRIEPILQALQALREHENPALEVLALQSWASPLLIFAGLKATICWGWSNQSGAFKSSAIRTGMALWASPDRSKEQKGVTGPGIETKLNNLKNLPIVIDEITDEAMLDLLLPAIQTVPEGGSGTRSTRSGEQREKKTWAAVLICGSNQSMHEYQLLKKATTDAKAARVFEFQVPKKDGKRNRTEIDTLISSLDHNFGHLGLLYAKFLAVNYDRLRDRYKLLADTAEADPRLAPVQNEERYWKATVAMTILSAEIANEVLQQEVFHVDEVRTFLYDTFVANRDWVKRYVNVAGEAQDCTRIMMGLLDHFMNNTLATDGLCTGRGDRRKLIPIQQPPVNAGHGNPVHVQWVVQPPMVRISLPALRDYLSEQSIGVNRIDDMKKVYGGKDHKKVNMTAGLDILTLTKARVDVWEIPITSEDHPLYDIWHAKAHHGLAMKPASAMSAAAQAQDNEDVFTAAMKAGQAQAAQDAATVQGATGAH